MVHAGQYKETGKWNTEQFCISCRSVWAILTDDQSYILCKHASYEGMTTLHIWCGDKGHNCNNWYCLLSIFSLQLMLFWIGNCQCVQCGFHIARMSRGDLWRLYSLHSKIYGQEHGRPRALSTVSRWVPYEGRSAPQLLKQILVLIQYGDGPML